MSYTTLYIVGIIEFLVLTAITIGLGVYLIGRKNK